MWLIQTPLTNIIDVINITFPWFLFQTTLTETGSVPLSAFHGQISVVKSDFIIYISKTASKLVLRLFQLYPCSFSHTFNPHSWQFFIFFKHLLFSTKPSHPLQIHLLALSHIEEQISCGCLCHVWLIQPPPTHPTFFFGGGALPFPPFFSIQYWI